MNMPTINKEQIVETGKKILCTVKEERGLVVAIGAALLAGISYFSTRKLSKIVNGKKD